MCLWCSHIQLWCSPDQKMPLCQKHTSFQGLLHTFKLWYSLESFVALTPSLSTYLYSSLVMLAISVSSWTYMAMPWGSHTLGHLWRAWTEEPNWTIFSACGQHWGLNSRSGKAGALNQRANPLGSLIIFKIIFTSLNFPIQGIIDPHSLMSHFYRTHDWLLSSPFPWPRVSTFLPSSQKSPLTPPSLCLH